VILPYDFLENVIPENNENKRALLYIRKMPFLSGIEV
jgi:hypothetical protein